MQATGNRLHRALGLDIWREIRHLPLRLSAFFALALFMVAVPLGCPGCAPIEAQSTLPEAVETQTGAQGEAHASGRPALEIVAGDLICLSPECSKESLSECTSCELAIRQRSEIAALLKEGKTKDEILDHFAATYGEKVLGNPRSFFAAGTPFLVALCGLIPIVLIMRSRHRQAAAQAVMQAAPKVEAGSVMARRSGKADSGQTDDARLKEALRDFDY